MLGAVVGSHVKQGLVRPEERREERGEGRGERGESRGVDAVPPC
jgi:hypothetical protein